MIFQYMEELINELIKEGYVLNIDDNISKLYEYIPNKTKCEDVSIILNKKGEC